MPKILINEKDRTSPGTPGSYANYSVLIAGFQTEFTEEELVKARDEIDAYDKAVEAIKKGNENIKLPDLSSTAKMLKAREDKADANGVYEFSSADDFKATIGCLGPRITKSLNGGSEYSVYHYGNQMAYELLKMGYTIVFKPIKGSLIKDGNIIEYPAAVLKEQLASKSFWEIFKDKSSYDFRFITHGLLSSDQEPEEVVKAKLELEQANALADKLDDIYEEAYATINDDTPGSESLNISDLCLAAYNKLSDTDYPAKDKFNDYEAATNEETGVKSLITDLANFIDGSENVRVTTQIINDANGCIANLAKYMTKPTEENDMYSTSIPGRGDCVALIELDESTYTSNANARPESLIIAAINEMSQIDAENGRFCAMTVPSVHYQMTVDSAFEDNKKFPGAFHYLACFMNSLKLGFAEWYAAAGYTRGISSYMVDHTSVKLGEIAINALEPRNFDSTPYPKFTCNVIANFRGSYYLWGNRTAHPIGKKGSLDTGDLVASHFLNIRQLCTTIKKQLYVACRMFTFDPNSDTLWFNFVNAIRPTLDGMKADQGIRDYRILKVFTDKKATLKAKIRIIPIEAVEDFDLEVSLEDSFGETAAVVTE